MNVADAIRAATQRLANTSDTARLDAELLMAHALGASRSDMLLRHMRDDTPPEFAELIDRRATSEPVAYITGVQEFYGREFRVTPDVLIPRGDSEVLIETALEIAPKAARVLDLGTGSGALLLTMLCENTALEGIGIDASAGAVAVAGDNAQRLGVADRAEMSVCNWRANGWSDHLGTFDLILCNPPYIRVDADLDRDVSAFEPGSALFAGTDGLDDYRVLIPQLRKLITKNSAIIFEIGATQGEAVRALSQGGGFTAEIRNDLAKRQRTVILR